MLLGTSEAIPVSDGQLKLGQSSHTNTYPYTPHPIIHSLIRSYTISQNTLCPLYPRNLTYSPFLSLLCFVGTWQSVIMVELDGPRTRTVGIQVNGVK